MHYFLASNFHAIRSRIAVGAVVTLFNGVVRISGQSLDHNALAMLEIVCGIDGATGGDQGCFIGLSRSINFRS